VVQQLWLLVLLVITGLLPAQAAPTRTAAKYSYYTTGTVYFQRGNVTPLQPLPTPQGRALRPLVLMGGGPDVDDAYRWMIDRAGITPASGGRFVVIRTTGTDAYDPYLYYSDKKKSTTTPAVDGYVGGAFLGLSAAETLVLSNRAAADDDFVNTVVGTANAVWIAGGDQSSYVNLWQGTKLNATLKNLLARNIPWAAPARGPT
jgi:cyanophycinase-like exopeptidase